MSAAVRDSLAKLRHADTGPSRDASFASAHLGPVPRLAGKVQLMCWFVFVAERLPRLRRSQQKPQRLAPDAPGASTLVRPLFAAGQRALLLPGRSVKPVKGPLTQSLQYGAEMKAQVSVSRARSLRSSRRSVPSGHAQDSRTLYVFRRTSSTGSTARTTTRRPARRARACVSLAVSLARVPL